MACFPLLMAMAMPAATPAADDAKKAVEAAALAMGAGGLKSVRISGSGFIYSVGQSASPGEAWPKFTLSNFTRTVNYEPPALLDQGMRSRSEAPRGGGQQPVIGRQPVSAAVSGTHAWAIAGQTANPQPAAVEERLAQIWSTPHGVLKAAATASPSLKGRTLSFTAHGKYKMAATLGADNTVEKVQTWVSNPVMGDMLVETSYSGYKDYRGVKFPSRIVQTQGGFPALEVDVTEVQPNVTADIAVPDNVRSASSAVAVKADKLADGVWYLTGGSHHSVAIEFKDHVVIVDAPLSEERSVAVIAEVKKAVPGKPLRYLVNTHHHFDHSGGMRAFAAEGAVILTHKINQAFYKKMASAPRTLAPDRLARARGKLKIETVDGKRVLTDGTRTVEIHHIAGNQHNDGILMVYLPKEKILVEADVFTPPPANAPPSPQNAPPNPFSVNLYANIERLGLAVEQIAALHGRAVPLADLKKFIGRP